LAEALNNDNVFGSLGDVYEKKYTRINLNYSSRGLVDTLKQSKYHGKLLLVIDQFEEIFRFKDKKENRDESLKFINLLLTASIETNTRIYIIITMRSDFLGRCSEFNGLPEKINEGQFLVPRLTRSQYKEAILRPLEISNIRVSMSPSLTSRVLNDIQDDPDQLPVLQHALMRTWKLWLAKTDAGKEATVIDIDIYEEVGGMANALGKHADEILGRLGKNLHRTTKKIFQRITEFNSDGLGIRRPRPFGDLVDVTGVDSEQVKQVINSYRIEGVNFLMPPSDHELDADTFIDISHESLIRKWKELDKWMKEEQLDKGTLIKLVEDSDDYESGKARLLSDRQLSGLLKWEKLKDERFLAWSSLYTTDVERQLKFLERSKKVNYRNYVLKVVGIPALLIFILTFSYLYYLSRVQAEKNANEVLYSRSKNYEQIKKLVVDSAYRMNQIGELNKYLAAEREKSSTLERELTVIRSSSNDLIKSRLENETSKKQLLNSHKVKSDSLNYLKREIEQLTRDYNSTLNELNVLKSEKNPEQKKAVSPDASIDFKGLSGRPIWIVFSLKEDITTGYRLIDEIRKDNPNLKLSLVAKAEKRVADLDVNLEELERGIYAIGISEASSGDLTTLRSQIDKMGIALFKITQLPKGKSAAYGNSKNPYVAIVVVLN
ncbi:MAG: hypothetical protein C0490_05650, partial [Marivirga sp.]|nr:hypothetical protein [Marivirga sp.]